MAVSFCSLCTSLWGIYIRLCNFSCTYIGVLLCICLVLIIAVSVFVLCFIYRCCLSKYLGSVSDVCFVSGLLVYVLVYVL